MLFSFLVPCASFHLQPGKVPAGSGHPALPVVLLLAAHYKTLCRERSLPFRKLRGECHNKFWLVVCRIFWRPLEGDSPRGGEMSRSDRGDRALFARALRSRLKGDSTRRA